jgi:putative PIN family toxin of toxin-antitoxin system
VRTKVVFDTNVYVSAAAPGAFSRGWLEAAGRPDRYFDVYSSDSILDELQSVLARKMKLKPDIIQAYLIEIMSCVTLVEPTEKIDVIKRDPDDNKILECAVAARAELIISADRDLLQLRGFRGITVYHPLNLKFLFPMDFGR